MLKNNNFNYFTNWEIASNVLNPGRKKHTIILKKSFDHFKERSLECCYDKNVFNQQNQVIY